MALVGTFGPDNTYSGRNVTWDAGVFTVEGLGEMTLETLRESQAAGQFAWASEETRAWAEGLAGATSVAGSGAQAPAVASSAVAATPREPRAPFRVRPWMAAAVVGLIVVAGVAMALAGKPPAPGGGGLPGGGGGGTVNHAPVASDDSYTTAQDTPLIVSAAEGVLANDTDADGDALSVGNTAGPAHGTMTVDSAGSLTYTPPAGFSGADYFTYEATDGREISSALVNITVTPGTGGGGGGGGGGSDSGGGSDGGGAAVYTKHTEIKASVILISIPVTGPYGIMYSYHYNCEFYAAGLRTHIVEVGKSEMKTLAVHKTSGRASLVNGLVKRLKKAGWTVTGRGRFWYSIKLSK